MVKIQETTQADIKAFNEKQWERADTDHYGKPMGWEEKRFALKAVQDGKIVGCLRLRIEGGVADLSQVIVDKEYRGKGIGKKLVFAAEKLAKKNGCHLVELVTGKDWPAATFYEPLGYTLAGEAPNYFHKKDFLWFVKEI